MAWHPTLRPRPPWCIRLPPRPHPQPGRGLGDRDIVGSRVSDLKRPSIRLQGASYLSTVVLPIGSGHGLLSTSVLVTGWPAGGVGRGHRAPAQGAGTGRWPGRWLRLCISCLEGKRASEQSRAGHCVLSGHSSGKPGGLTAYEPLGNIRVWGCCPRPLLPTTLGWG